MIIKVSVDKERAKSMLKLIEDRESFVSSLDVFKFPTIAVENYYEILKEIGIAILLLEGYRTVGEYAHKEIIDYLGKYPEIERGELELMDDLRSKRNKSSYEGKKVDVSFIENRKNNILKVISKLKDILNKKLK